jgi:lysozyme
VSRFDAGLLARARAWAGASAPPAEVAQAPDPLDLALEVALALMRRFEGFYGQAYLCPAGIWTIGYGATYYLDGRRVRAGDTISREAAERLLLLMVRRVYLPAVLRLCPGIRDPKRLAAIIDFCFNLGEPALAASTLRRRINEERWAEVPAELRKWIHSRGRPLRGLILRREAEAALI